MFSDNPNYFDEQVATRSKESSSKSFFLFKKRNSCGKLVSPKATTNSNEQSRRSESLRGLLRVRSNSTTSSSLIKSDGSNRKHNTLDYRNCSESRRIVRAAINRSNSENNDDDVFEPSSHNSPGSFTQYSDTSSSESRRHSIGTFVTKDHLRMGSISDEVPKVLAPKAPVNLRSASSNENSPSISDDILFVTTRHNEQALLWVNHLKTCFDKITKQRGRLPFNFLHLKIDEGQITPDLVQRCLSTKLQIVIICPTLLSLSPQYLLSTLGSLLKPERVLGVLLGVTETRVWEIHKTTFPAYNKWRTCAVGDHEQSFVSELLGIATDILGRALRQQPLLASETAAGPQNSSGTAGSHQKSQAPHLAASAGHHHETFTLFPRKVKVGQNKIIVIFVEPLVKDDWIKIKVEKANEIIEITNIKRRNPYTIQFSIPESCMEISMMIGIRLEKNNIDLGCRPLKCESRIRELEQILKAQDAPMEFLCQSLGIATSDRNRLDTYLLQSFQKNVPPNFHLLNSTDHCENGFKMARETSPEEYPTLLHFAAYWGLERLCLQLMDCPGGDIACEIRNISGRTPVDLAELGGHYKLAKSFRNFSQLHEFSTMYHYFKGISDASTGKVIIEPKLTSSTCSKMESSKTASSKGEHQQQHHHQSEGYMEMNGSGSDIESSQTENVNSVANLNYLNLDVASGSGGGHDEVDFIFDQKKQAEKDKEILNNLNNSEEIDPIDHNVLFNELRITEPEYYDSDDINRSDSFSQECSNVLENFTVLENCDSNYLIQPSNVPVRKIDLESDYLIQPSNIPVHEYSNLDISSGQHSIRNKETESGRETSHLRLSFKKKEQDSSVKSKSGTLKRQESNSSKKSVDDELLEILSDFKNNVFTIMEVEQLFDSWKSRNDVQKSFIDKQEQLQQMREEYERIQHQMKEKLKRPTPFDRMKRIFSRSKSSTSKKNSVAEGVPVDVCDDIKFSLLAPASSSHRPISSSSLHSISSGSSGRVSILSSASFGDSGTHSDSEDRRAGNPSFSSNRTPRTNSLMDNYMIPPAPRPFITPSSTPTPVEEKDLPSFPSSNEAAEHYTCIPSNKPVHSDSIFPYENCSMLMSIDETKETETAVQPIKVQRSEIIYTKLADVRPTMSSFRNNHPKETAQSHNTGS